MCLCALLTKRQQRKRRHARVRAKIIGTSTVPRVLVFRSNKNIFVQLIDDTAGKTLVSSAIKSASKPGSRSSDGGKAAKDMSELSLPGKSKSAKKQTKTDAASLAGEALAKKALDAGIKKVVFDRGGYKYHGRVRALAEGLRKSGLQF